MSGQSTYCHYLGLDFEGDALWALDMCRPNYAKRWENRHFIGPDPQFDPAEDLLAQNVQ